MSGGPITAVVISASEVRVGDSIVLPHLGPREVVEISEYVETTGKDPGPRVRIVYRVVGGGVAFENKATEHGAKVWPQAEATVRPLRPDEPVAIERSFDCDELGELQP